jgi:hypothetical protein
MKATQVKVELKKQDAKESVGLDWLRKVLSGEFCEHGNKPTGSIYFISFLCALFNGAVTVILTI